MGGLTPNGIGEKPKTEDVIITNNTIPLAEETVEITDTALDIEPLELLTDTLVNFGATAGEYPAEVEKMSGALTREIYEVLGITEHNPENLNPDTASRIEALADAVMSNEPEEIETATEALFNGAIDSPERLNQLAGYMLAQNGGHLAGLSVGGANPWQIAQDKARRETERAMNVATAGMANGGFGSRPDLDAMMPDLINWMAENASNTTEKTQEHFLAIMQDPNSTDAQKAAAGMALRESMIEDLKSNPATADLSQDEFEYLADNLTAEFLFKNDPEKYPTIDAAEAEVTKIIANAAHLAKNDPQAFKLLIESTKNFITQSVAADELLENISATSNAIELTEEMKDSVVISLDYLQAGDESRIELYAGTGLSEDGKTILNIEGQPTQYFMTTSSDNDTFLPVNLQYAIAAENDKGHELAEQIRNSGLDLDQLSSETQDLLKDLDLYDIEKLAQSFADANGTHMHDAWGYLINDPAFIDTVGNYGLQQEIQSQLDDGQVFANDERMQEIADKKLNTGDLIHTQKELIAELEEQKEVLKMDLDHPILGTFTLAKIKQIDTQITDANETITRIETAQAELAEAEQLQAQAEQNFENAQANDRDGLGLGMVNASLTGAFSAVAPMDGMDGSDLSYAMDAKEESLAELANIRAGTELEGTALEQAIYEEAVLQSIGTDGEINQSEINEAFTKLGMHSDELDAAQNRITSFLADEHGITVAADVEPKLSTTVVEEEWDRSRHSHLETAAQELVDEILSSPEAVSTADMEAMIRHHNLLGAFNEDSLLIVQEIMEEKSPSYEFSNAPLSAHYIEQDVFQEIYDNVGIDSISKEDIVNMLSDAGLEGEQLLASTEQVIAELQTEIGVDFVTGLEYPQTVAEEYNVGENNAPAIEEPAAPAEEAPTVQPANYDPDDPQYQNTGGAAPMV